MNVQRISSQGPSEKLFSVGVTGHRPDGLKEANQAILRKTIKNILLMLARSVGQHLSAVSMCVVSPLAEGADRMVASEGLHSGYKLCCPLPFELEVYENDFIASNGRREFRELLRKADLVIELRGSHDTEQDRTCSYMAVGRAVLSRSDILIAIWDGRPARGTGGTAQVVNQSLEMGIPVIWVHSQAPHPSTLLLPHSFDMDSSTARILEGIPLSGISVI